MFGIPSQLLLIILCGIILLITVVLSISRDARAIRTNAQLTRLFIQSGKQRSQKSITVLIYLDKRADTILPLLDQLYTQHYKKLEVIVIIKQTAGKNARLQLNSYKRTHKVALRLLTYRAGMTDISIVKKYAKNEWVVCLYPGYTLGKNFFSLISFDTLLAPTDVVVPKMYTRLDTTVNTAIRAYSRLISPPHFTFGAPTIQPGIVYKRRSIEKVPLSSRIVISEDAYLTTNENQLFIPSVKFSRVVFFKVSLLTISVGIIGFFLTQMNDTEKLLIIATLVGAAFYLFASKILVNAAYSVMDKINLILLSPIFLGYRVGISVFVALRTMTLSFKKYLSNVRRASA